MEYIMRGVRLNVLNYTKSIMIERMTFMHAKICMRFTDDMFTKYRQHIQTQIR